MADILKSIQERVSVLQSLTLDDVTNSIFSASASASNSQAETEAAFNAALAERLLCSHLKSVIEKRYDRAKDNIDVLGVSLGIDAVVVLPGNRQAVYEDNVFIFQKVVKRAATTIDTTKLKINLARKGMDPKDIDEVFALSTTERAPQTIYEVLPKV